MITVGQSTAANVIPDAATLRASVRVLSRESIEQLREDIPRLADGICSAHGCTAETAFVLGELTALYGEDRVTTLAQPRTGS